MSQVRNHLKLAVLGDSASTSLLIPTQPNDVSMENYVHVYFHCALKIHTFENVENKYGPGVFRVSRSGYNDKKLYCFLYLSKTYEGHLESS